ncbi:MAG: aminodeoxychorismate synthase component I [Saprospiraceae bacterium]
MNKVLVSRISTSFSLEDHPQFKQRCLAWAASYELVSWLDSNEYQGDNYGDYEVILGVGRAEGLLCWEAVGAFAKLKAWHEQTQDWLFGFLAYDLKNDVEALQSHHSSTIPFPELHFFQPEIVITLSQKTVTIHSKDVEPSTIFELIANTELATKNVVQNQGINLQANMAKEAYLATVEKIRQHIIEGDLYEMNFCQAFHAQASLHPFQLFERLNGLSKAPFAGLYKRKDQYLICASPERFMKKTGDKIISEPIKGTIKRGTTLEEDQQLKKDLYDSEKDRAENVMIVDLVRNDLARTCLPGSVQVEELFGIYSFEQVHHMISRVTGQLKPEVHFVDLLKNAFPMGSMTGAPKVMSMELIEQYEKTKRGIYSGALGYISPTGDFDFNVVIRSIIYEEKGEDSQLSFQVGGAIVYDSVPEQEYKECLLKAKGLLAALGIAAV